MNVGIYTRVSSERQMLEGKSLEWQDHELMEYAKINNLNVVDKYVEKGISGDSIEKRPELKRLLRDIKNKKIDNLLVYKVDRLGRKTLTNAVICKVLIDTKCILTTSAYGVMDLDKAYDKFMYNMLSAISQFEVDNLSERVTNGKKQRVRDGLYLNSYSVYGYDNYYDAYCGERLLKVNDYESKIVNEIFNLYLDGYSMNKIAEYLTNNNIECKRGGNWCQSTIYQILTNRLYIGKVVYKGKKKSEQFENDGKHQAIISLDLFEKVNNLINERKRDTTKKLPNEYSYFAPVLKCCYCNSTLKPKQTKAKDKTSIRYYCKNKDCILNSIKHIDLEEKFINKLSNIKINYDEKIIKEFCSNDDYDIVLNSLNKIKQKEKEIYELFTNNLITKDSYVEMLNVSNIKKNKFNDMLESLKDKVTIFDDNVKNSILNILDKKLSFNFQKLDNLDKMVFINLFIDEIKISNNRIYIKWKTKDNEEF